MKYISIYLFFFIFLYYCIFDPHLHNTYTEDLKGQLILTGWKDPKVIRNYIMTISGAIYIKHYLYIHILLYYVIIYIIRYYTIHITVL